MPAVGENKPTEEKKEAEAPAEAEAQEAAETAEETEAFRAELRALHGAFERRDVATLSRSCLVEVARAFLRKRKAVAVDRRLVLDAVILHDRLDLVHAVVGDKRQGVEAEAVLATGQDGGRLQVVEAEGVRLATDETKTSEGRYGKFYVSDWDTAANLTINWLTWDYR